MIYTRGFTARKILRKAVTRDRNATSFEPPLSFEERKNHFLRGAGLVYSYWGTSREEKNRGERFVKKYVRVEALTEDGWLIDV